MSIPCVPLVGLPACLRSINERTFHTLNDRYPSALIAATD